MSAALRLQSANGKRYDERLAGIRTERELSLVYEELIASVPLGKRLFADANPVRTGGPMQVGIRFAEEHAKAHGYPYPIRESIRREVFTPRGGMHFGIAHLLGVSTVPALYLMPRDATAGQVPIPLGQGMLSADEIVQRIHVLTRTRPGEDF